MITLSTILMVISVAGLAYLIGSIQGYTRGAEDIKRIYEEHK
jgi:hypothetical protein